MAAPSVRIDRTLKEFASLASNPNDVKFAEEVPTLARLTVIMRRNGRPLLQSFERGENPYGIRPLSVNSHGPYVTVTAELESGQPLQIFYSTITGTKGTYQPFSAREIVGNPGNPVITDADLYDRVSDSDVTTRVSFGFIWESRTGMTFYRQQPIVKVKKATLFSSEKSIVHYIFDEKSRVAYKFLGEAPREEEREPKLVRPDTADALRYSFEGQQL
ncbi:MAG TPA: hypothetical protein VL944_00655 [Candidatus Acidoferrum sp.]|nr:hypothetical protein [Candidatus Acidoferrum sp.]